jgi:transcriptional regulator with XRE-family HTH domain
MATTVCARLGRRIRELRKVKGWRQIDLAAHAKLSQNHICDIERGQAEVGLKTLEALADALGTTMDRLLKDL